MARTATKPKPSPYTSTPKTRGDAYMRPEEFERTCVNLFGETWTGDMMELTGKDYATLRRYVTGRIPIPKIIALLVHVLNHRKTMVTEIAGCLHPLNQH